MNYKKIAEENRSKISGIDVASEIEKLKAGTYDNILMTSKQLNSVNEDKGPSDMSPSMQTIENELKSLAQKDPKEAHVSPTPDNSKADPLTYYSSVNHNHSDPQPKDESKVAIDAKDLASGIVEALSGNKDAKKES